MSHRGHRAQPAPAVFFSQPPWSLAKRPALSQVGADPDQADKLPAMPEVFETIASRTPHRALGGRPPAKPAPSKYSLFRLIEILRLDAT